jgi:hypothetical protein
MKTSNKALLGVSAGVCGVIVIVAIVLRVVLLHDVQVAPNNTTAPVSGVRNLALTPFTKLHAKGVWDIHLVPSATPHIRVEGPQNLIQRISALQTGARVELTIDESSPRDVNGIFTKIGMVAGGRVKAIVGAPGIESVDLVGKTKLRLEKVELPTLTIYGSGLTKVFGGQNRIGTLRLNLAGVSEVDFTVDRVTNADLQLSGKYTIGLGMAGGTVTGRLTDSGEILLLGTVASEDLHHHFEEVEIIHLEAGQPVPDGFFGRPKKSARRE